mgnify:CR=1 FL=1
MNTFNEILLNRLGEIEFQEIKNPKSLHFFYKIFGEFYNCGLLHKKEDISNYILLLEKEYGLNVEICVEFLVHLKSIYKNFHDEAVLESKSIDNISKSYLRNCYESYDENTSSLVKIIINAYWCYNNSVLYMGKKNVFKYPSKKYMDAFLKSTLADLKVIILFIKNEIDKLKELNHKDFSAVEKVNSHRLNVSKVENSFSKIHWKENLKDLVFLFDELVRLGFIANHNNINKLIANHFTGKNSEIKPNEIADLRSKLKKKYISLYPSEPIKDIVEKLSKRKE